MRLPWRRTTTEVRTTGNNPISELPSVECARQFGGYFGMLNHDDMLNISMLGSRYRHRGNVPLAMRLKIELRAHLAPLERYGLPGLSSATTYSVTALVRALRGALCSA